MPICSSTNCSFNMFLTFFKIFVIVALETSNNCPNLVCGSPVRSLIKNIARAVLYFFKRSLNKGVLFINVEKFQVPIISA